MSTVAVSLPRLPVARMARAMGVSVSTTLLSLGVLTVLVQTRAMTPSVANVVATIAGIFPSYVLNRRWVWGRRGRGDWRREVLPFWVMCLTALVLSTLAVGAAASWADATALSTTARTVVVVGANVVTFGALWLAQFLLLDRVLFVHRPEVP